MQVTSSILEFLRFSTCHPPLPFPHRTERIRLPQYRVAEDTFQGQDVGQGNRVGNSPGQPQEECGGAEALTAAGSCVPAPPAIRGDLRPVPCDCMTFTSRDKFPRSRRSARASGWQKQQPGAGQGKAPPTA
jgi:hypothetical protein